MDHRDILHEAVALDQADVPSRKEVFFFFKNAARLTEKFCYDFFFARTGCVDRDNQLFETVSLARLRRLDERETAVVLQAVMVGNWVKTVEIQFHLLTGNGKTFQKAAVIVRSFFDLGQSFFFSTAFLASPQAAGAVVFRQLAGSTFPDWLKRLDKFRLFSRHQP